MSQFVSCRRVMHAARDRFYSVSTRKSLRSAVFVLAACLIVALAPRLSAGQEPGDAANTNPAELARQVAELRAMVQQLQAQVKELQARPQGANSGETASGSPPDKPLLSSGSTSAASTPALPAEVSAASVVTQTAAAASPPTPTGFDLLQGTTVNFLFDGYYDHNFNDPIGRVSLLRAYDVVSNAFAVNQADLVLENAPDPANGKRWGARLDLQFGQATETLQGNAANEPRPEIYRNIFQAYGTYVVPVGSGLNIDFGKWASSLGIEGNYTKDQMNYSRSFWFNFLPFYHTGIRTHYQINDKLGVNYWITNGTQQTEPFNSYKDQLVGLALQPAKSLSWTVNYYRGQEHPDFQFVENGASSLPTLQGMPFEPIPNPPTGKLNIFDTYATWNTTPKLTFAWEGDYVIERLYTTSAPSHADGGAAYARYQLTPKIALAARSEYLSDRGGLFSGETQALKEGTVTFEYKFSDNFLMREEWRRDWSNQAYFYTPTLGLLKTNQTTATIGLDWWFGGKKGAW